MKRIYLSGPMTGRPDLNFPAFHAAAARLRALGYDVVSPAEIVPGTKATWHDAMRADIKDLLDCDTLALLEGWQESAGAHLEMHVAHRVGITIAIEAEIVERCAGPSEERSVLGSIQEPAVITVKVGGYRRYAVIGQNGIQMDVLQQANKWWSPERLATIPNFLGWKDLDWQYDEVETREAKS